MTGTFVLSRLVRPDIAKELVFTAKVVSGTEAHELGLATHGHAEPLRRRLGSGTRDRRAQPGRGAGTKALLNRAPFADAAEQFADERQAIGSLIGTPDQVEAVMANFEKRPALPRLSLVGWLRFASPASDSLRSAMRSSGLPAAHCAALAALPIRGGSEPNAACRLRSHPMGPRGWALS